MTETGLAMINEGVAQHPDRLLRALGLTADRLLDHDRVADEDTDA